MWLMLDEAHITTIAMRTTWRGKGLGELLLASLVETAFDIGAHRITLEVRVSNEAAQNLYRKYSFAPEGVRPRYYSDNNEDAYIMTTSDIRDESYRARFEDLVKALRARFEANEDVPVDAPAILAVEDGRAVVCGRTVLILAVETSCDETSVALVDHGRLVKANAVSSQIALHAPYGGVVPEIASRQHVRSIAAIAEHALHDAGLSLDEVDAVAATRGPGLAGALLVGYNFARGLALGRNLPFAAVNHLEGHLHSVWLSHSDPPPPQPELPMLALIVSGGHTELVLMRDHGAYEVLGETLDERRGRGIRQGRPPVGPRLSGRARHTGCRLEWGRNGNFTSRSATRHVQLQFQWPEDGCPPPRARHGSAAASEFADQLSQCQAGRCHRPQ